MATMAERRRATDQRIYEAAIEEFGKNGYANTTLTRIARSSGITAGLIVQNFGSKEDLYKKITSDVTEMILKRIIPQSTAWDIRFVSSIEQTIKSLKEDPKAVRYMAFYFSALTSLDAPESVRRELWDIYDRSNAQETIAEGQRKGDIIAGDQFALYALFWIDAIGTILYCHRNGLEYPPTEWFLQIIRKR